MGRAPCCSKVGLMRGPWSAKEDALLTNYIQQHGEGQWRSLPKKAGLLRCGKSCRLRWMNYLRPGIKRGNISEDEEDLIVRLHGLLGNRWSLIAGRLPGRTDNEIKNYWNTYLLKKLQNAGINPNPHKNLPKPTKKSKNSDENPKKKKKQSNVAKKSTEGSGQKDEDAVNHTSSDQGKVNGGSDNKNTTSDDDGTVAKVKVYLPKAMRVSSSSSFMPRTDSLSSLASGAASSSSNSAVGGGDQIAPEVTWQAPMFELGDVGNYYSDDDAGFLGGNIGDDGFLLPFLNQPMDSVPMPGGDVGMYDVVYEEYLRLLNLDN